MQFLLLSKHASINIKKLLSIYYIPGIDLSTYNLFNPHHPHFIEEET